MPNTSKYPKNIQKHALLKFCIFITIVMQRICISLGMFSYNAKKNTNLTMRPDNLLPEPYLRGAMGRGAFAPSRQILVH